MIWFVNMVTPLPNGLSITRICTEKFCKFNNTSRLTILGKVIWQRQLGKASYNVVYYLHLNGSQNYLVIVRKIFIHF